MAVNNRSTSQKIFVIIIFVALIATVVMFSRSKKPEVAKKSISDSERQYQLGRAQISKQDFLGAQESLTKAIELEPNLKAAIELRGDVYTEMKQYDAAISDYTRALELDAKSVKLYVKRGIAYRQKRENFKAIRDLSMAIELDDTRAEAYNNRAGLYFRMQNRDGALDDFDKAIELLPTYAKAYNNRGVVHAANRDIDKASADFAKALELDPELASAYFHMAKVLRFRGEKLEAHRYLNNALRYASPEKEQALIQMAEQEIDKIKSEEENPTEKKESGEEWYKEYKGSNKK